MSQIVGTATFSTTSGTATVTLGFQPTWMRVTVGGKSGGDTYFCKSDGIVIGSTQKVITSTTTETSEPQNKIIRHKNSSGTVDFEATFIGFTSTGVQFNVTTSTTTLYPAVIEASDRA